VRQSAENAGRFAFASTPAVIALALALTLAARGPAGAGDVDRAAIDAAFRGQLQLLATKCDEQELRQQAGVTRAWFPPRDPRRYYLFLPSVQDPTRPDPDAPKLVQFWHEKFSEVRKEQAQRLFSLARSRAESADEAEAYRLLHEVLHEDPDHAEARRMLGYEQASGTWRKRFRKPQSRPVRAAHPMFGWPRGQYWRVDSEHFQVTTNVSAKAGLQAAEFLERVHGAWQQLFYEYWTVPGRLTARFDKDAGPLGPQRDYQVVLFSDQDEYVRQLGKFAPQKVAISSAIYSERWKMSFLYVNDDDSRAPWVHEATHQFFQESGESVPTVGSHSNFWAVEGVALYMESLIDRGVVCTTGGADADRLQYARYRALNEGYYVPLEKLVAYERDRFEQDEDIRRLYSQSAGLAHFFMDGDGQAMRRPFIAYLRTVYRGLGKPETLSGEVGEEYASLDQQYRQFLDVTDRDLAFVDRNCRSLCLGHTSVTDAGLALRTEWERLRWLDLSFTAATDAGLASFAAAPRLDQLSLEKTRISARSLDTVAQFRELEELDISQTDIGDQALGKLAGLARLKILWLTGTRVTDEGIQQLAALRGLEQLDVQGTAVTAAGLARLKERLPNLK